MRLPARLLRRKADSHKGDFGHILILAGSLEYSGAGILAARAALRCGAGLVTLAVPKSLTNAILKVKPPEVMLLPLKGTKDSAFSLEAYTQIKEFYKKTDVLVVGPGLTQNRSTQKLVHKALIRYKNKPRIVDADGLNAVNKNPGLLDQAIITPHAGEMSRLNGQSVKEIEKNRKSIAKKYACDYNLTIVLKGKNSLVADCRGNFYINKTGNPGMATAGSGDVLAGMIGAFKGQGLSDFLACKYAVYLHGLAGDLAAKEKTQLGLIASDIIEKIPEAIKLMN